MLVNDVPEEADGLVPDYGASPEPHKGDQKGGDNSDKTRMLRWKRSRRR